jgi:C1A family cysteine protease
MRIISTITTFILSFFTVSNATYLRDNKELLSIDNRSNHPLLDKFENWLHTFKIHIDDTNHYYSTFGKWVDNDEYIEQMNTLGLSYSLGHNQFSGMDSDDYHQFLVNSNMFSWVDGNNSFERNMFNSTLESTYLPIQVNWVTAGAVTPVKDQGQCGSCWSFSTTGALEGAYYIKNSKLLSFSDQQLVDCDNLKHGGRDHGCNGGLMDNAFTWIHKNGGICLESEYPYVSGTTQKSGECQIICDKVPGSIIQGYTDVPTSNDNSMMSALSQQPVSIAIEADQRDFQLYKSGIFTGECGTNLDHGVLVVGYGTQESEDYSLVKNSWGTSWGEQGYIKLGRGLEYNSGQGQCGLLMEGSFPIL